MLLASCASVREAGVLDVQSRPDDFAGKEDSLPETGMETVTLELAAEIPVPEPAAEAEPAPGAEISVPELTKKYWGRGAYFSISRARNAETRRLWIDRILALELDHLVLEDVGGYLGNPRRVLDFITELKAARPDISVGISGDTVSFFRSVQALPALYSLLDTFHYDFEFWNPARYNYLSREDAFVRSLSDLQALRELTKNTTIKVEMVLGWFSAQEADLLGPLLDRVFLGSYMADSSSIQTHIAERFMAYPAHSLIDARVLLSADSRYSSQKLYALGLSAFEGRYREYALNIPAISGVFWSSVELLADAKVIK